MADHTKTLSVMQNEEFHSLLNKRRYTRVLNYIQFFFIQVTCCNSVT